MNINELQVLLKSLKNKQQELAKVLNLDFKKQQLKKLESIISDKDFWSNHEEAIMISKKFEALKTEINDWQYIEQNLPEYEKILLDLQSNPDFELLEELKQNLLKIKKQLQNFEFKVLFAGKYDEKSAIVAIHAGSGGVDAQDWVEMLLRMYLKYAEKKNFKVEILEKISGQEAGIKTVVLRIIGYQAYGYFKSENGTHRLVRISPFDAEKMRHTSFALVEVIPELDEEIKIEIKPEDLRIDTFCASGHGGQSVNTTYSAVRVVHLPTKITVTCQNERSQQQNKEIALKILKSKLQKIHDENEEKEKQKLRGEYKSPEWGNQIRSYVLHPYHLVKDLRTGYETTDERAVLNGNLDGFVEAYLKQLYLTAYDKKK